MIATIIAFIIALGGGAWALYERYAKNKLKEIINGMMIEASIVKGDLKRTEGLLEEEKVLLAQEKKKTLELEKTPFDFQEKAMAPTLEEDIDIVALVDATGTFKIEDDERAVFFEFYKDSNRELRWRLKAKNNKVLADSGEGYGTKQNLKKALGVMLNAIKKSELRSKWKA